MTAAQALLPEFSWGNEVKCANCGRMTIHSRCRLLTKTAEAKWRCNQCNVTCTQLRRVHGEWPLQAFSRLSQEVLNRKCQVSGIADQTCVDLLQEPAQPLL